MADTPDKLTIDGTRNLNMDHHPEEKEFLENDSCLERGVKPGTDDEKKEEDEEGKKKTVKEKIRERCSCLALTWRGIVIFICLCVFAFLLIIVVIVLAANMDCWGGFSSSVCQSPDCLKAAAEMLRGLNTTAKPCEDFYEFACGRWLVDPENLVEAEARGRYTARQRSVRHYHERVRMILNTQPFTDNVTSVQWKVKAFYDSCMNVDNVKAAGPMPLVRLIEKLRGWNVIGWSESGWDFNWALRILHEQYGVYPFFKPTIQLDPQLSDRAIIQIQPSGLGLAHPSYYHRKEHDKVVVAYKQLLRDIVRQMGATSTAANTFADDIFSFEKRIAYIYPEVQTEMLNSNKFVTVNDLRIRARRVHWLEHLSSMFESVNVKDNTRVAANLTYLQEISRIISTADNSVLNNYMLWKLAHHYAAYLPQTFTQALDNFNHALTGSSTPVPRWEFCMQELENLFPMAVSSMFVHTELISEVFDRVAHFYQTISDTLAERIKYYKWMDERTRQLAMEKARMMRTQISMPPPVNSSAMSHHYQDIVVLKSDFFQNILHGVYFKNNQAVSWLKNASSMIWYQGSMGDRQPFIIPSRRKMEIPYSLLQRPVFDLIHPASVNFGSLGFLIGRTLIEAFEDAEEYDSEWKHHMHHHYRHHHHNGYQNEMNQNNLEDKFVPQWWSNYTVEEYRRHQNCVAEEYSKYVVRDDEVQDFRYKMPDQNIKGNQTVGENVYDLGGLIQAYHAYEKWEYDNGKDKKLPVLHDKTHNMMFFIGFAQSMCAITKPETMMDTLHISRFSPNKVRVNGVVSHMPEFAYAFSCSSSDPMNAYYKCYGW